MKSEKIFPKKSLGQNFLIDPNIIGKISNIDKEISSFPILEVGPGFGAMTTSLLKKGPKKLFAIEKDPRFTDSLNQIKSIYPENFDFVIADALEFDYSLLLGKDVKIFSNLPYNIATKLLVKWLKANLSSVKWRTLTLMFQKEVADRITSKSGTKNYGRLAVLTQLFSDAEQKFDIPKNCFRPQPKVMSSIIHFEALSETRYPCNFKLLEKIVFLAFNQRRKTLKNSLSSLHNEITTVLENCNICPSSRAQNLTLHQYCNLSLKI